MGRLPELTVVMVMSPDMGDFFPIREEAFVAGLGDHGGEIAVNPVGGADFFESDSAGAGADIVVFSIHHGAVQDPVDIDTEYQKRLETHMRNLVDGGATVIALNGSTIVPDDTTHNYRGVDATLSERIRRLNLALVRVSSSTGISVVDVDRIVAEVGASTGVRDTLRYSGEIATEVRGEVIRVLGEKGGSFSRLDTPETTGVLEMKLPYINKQMSEGVVLKWHAAEGERVEYGQPVLDLEIDRVKLLQRSKSDAFLTSYDDDEPEDPAARSFRNRTNVRVAHRVVASDDGYVRRIEAGPGDRVHVGDLLALVSLSPDDELDNPPAGVFRSVVNILEGEST